MQLGAAASLSKSVQAALHLKGYVEIRIDPAEELTKTPGVAWAIDQLKAALAAKEVSTKGSGSPAVTIVIAPFNNALTTGFALPAHRKPEMIALIPSHDRDNRILVSGIDTRGL